jgi:putative DNA primase/helicase
MNPSLSTIGRSPGEIVVSDDLRERDQWVLWKYEEREGRATKVPYQVGRGRASSTDQSTWASFEAVMNEWRLASERYAGLGFVFSAADPFCGIGLDDLLEYR